jgi:Family of unknown function (DUF5990)
MTTGDLTIEVVCRNLPGSCFTDLQNPAAEKQEPVYLGIQKGNEVIEAVRADRKQVIFRPTFRIARQPDGSPNFLGPFAKGTPQERFFYLSWGVMDRNGHFEMFRRAKIHLNHLTWDHLRAALDKNIPLKVAIDMTSHKGDPICGSIRIRKPMIKGGISKERERADWQI